ncbi:von Willebrand factor A domain-containing protein DDB_G0286969 [Musca vetustissima]|uniref:von Willebrand factor A domain-containing protein DDB_G0286969 n=1 Tax=Musca vetustissima TaxID=27455 RepID=UPI002AB76F02|nr:von Willebrand factor A domain-containing protein DDB_G0286969 [Musca vetustissima]
MKAFGLILTTLGLVALAHSTHLDYPLKCQSSEMGIRWPNYYDKSEYFVCNVLGGKPMVITCNPGEVFTFVLQLCTSPSKYIPAPPAARLPLAASTATDRKDTEGHPPIETNDKEIAAVPPTVDVAVPEAPIVVDEAKPVEEVKPVEETKPVEEVAVDADANKEKEQSNIDVPLPPTPAPTPPVVAVEEEKPHAKKPSADKKKSSSKSKNEKKKSTGDKAKAGKKAAKKPAKKADNAKKTKTDSKKKEKTPKA